MQIIPYRGYIAHGKVIIRGRIIRGRIRKITKKDSILVNMSSMIKRFIVFPKRNIEVNIQYGKEKKTTKTNEKGYYKAVFKESKAFSANITVASYSAKSEIFIQKKGINLISDIDDTLLISHINNFFKKIYILFSKNALTRKPVKGMKQFVGNISGNVFYVSNSQWRLYDALEQFLGENKFPEGPILLRGTSKKTRIKEILNTYKGKFILVGDDGQKDPVIYAQICEEYKNRIKAVCIHHLSSKSKLKKTKRLLKNMPVIISEDTRDFQAALHKNFK